MDVRAASPILRVGVSTHTSVEVVAAARAGADFVFFGPILETPSKRNLVSPRGIAGLQVVTDNEVPVLALGGITPEVTSACRAAGAAGVACIRAVLEAPDPAIVVMAFLSRFGG